MADVNDMDLMRDYADHKSETAFAGLVRRHLNLVYSVALRYTGNSADAQDVAQAVFVILGQKAASLRERTTLTGWLYETTRLVARQSVRTRHRQQTRDQEAYMQSTLNESGPDGTWQQLAPLLEEGMTRLTEDERTLLALRFFENKTAVETAALLGIQEWAAHKRANRAVEKLRTYFARRGVVLSATTLTAAIAANSVSAAPSGLAAAITTATLTGTAAVSTSALLATTKTIAMTTLQKTLVTAALTAAIGGGIYEAHQAAQLREQTRTLQQQLSPLTAQVQQLQQERDTATSRQASLADELAKTKSNEQELLKLRNEMTLLHRNPAADTIPTDTLSAPVQTTQTTGPSPEDVGRELGLAVVRGDAGAFDKLLEESKSEYQSFSLNSAGLDDTHRGDLSRRTFATINAAFDEIAEAAANGSQPALDAVIRSIAVPELKSLATESLGMLAMKGNDPALEMLVNCEKYGLLLSSSVSALQGAASVGNQKAIDALAAVAGNETHQTLWNLTALSLSKAAVAGNPVAIDALISMSSATTNQNILSAVIPPLKSAAANQNVKAAEALRSLGIP